MVMAAVIVVGWWWFHDHDYNHGDNGDGGGDSGDAELDSATNMPALATTTFLSVATLRLDFTQTSSRDGKCDRLFFFPISSSVMIMTVTMMIDDDDDNDIATIYYYLIVCEDGNGDNENQFSRLRVLWVVFWRQWW